MDKILMLQLTNVEYLITDVLDLL